MRKSNGARCLPAPQLSLATGEFVVLSAPDIPFVTYGSTQNPGRIRKGASGGGAFHDSQKIHASKHSARHGLESLDVPGSLSPADEGDES